MRAPMADTDARAFEATWQLIPERCSYEHELPPRSGTYKIAATPEGLAFTLDWISSSGSVEHTEFRLRWEAESPIPLGLVAPRTLNTAGERDDVVVAHATRKLSEDGNELEVIQRGQTSEGKPF